MSGIEADGPALGTLPVSVAKTRPKESLLRFIGIEDDPAYRWVLLVFGLMAVANILTYFVGSNSLTFLEASKFQPWGAVTSIGLYDSWESTVALPLLVLLWFLLNTRILGPERRRRSLLLTIGSAYAAVLANVVWLFSRSQFEFTMGVSGFEVAVGGIMLVITLANLFSLRSHRVPNLIRLRETDKASMVRLLGFVYIALAMILVLTWATLIELSGELVNTEVHVVSLTLGIGLATVYELVSAAKLRHSSGQLSFELSS